jgi:hypothetical protein
VALRAAEGDAAAPAMLAILFQGIAGTGFRRHGLRERGVVETSHRMLA